MILETTRALSKIECQRYKGRGATKKRKKAPNKLVSVEETLDVSDFLNVNDSWDVNDLALLESAHPFAHNLHQ